MKADEQLEQILKERYEFEHQRKQQILDNAGFPVSLVSIFAGSVAFYLQDPAPWPVVESEVLLLVLAAISVGAFLFASYSLARLMFGPYKYGYLPDALEIRKYHKELGAYLTTVYPTDHIEKTETEFRDFIISEYAEWADVNAKTNDRRSGYLFRAKASAFLGIVLLLPPLTAYAMYAESVENERGKGNVYVWEGHINQGPRSGSGSTDATKQDNSGSKTSVTSATPKGKTAPRRSRPAVSDSR